VIEHLIAIALVLSPTPAPSMEGVQATCSSWAELAGRVMDLRQDGMAMEEAMDHTLDNRFLEALVVDAYQVAQLTSPHLRKQQTYEFKNKWYLNCLRGGQGIGQQ
jgi:hypothetical protein